MRKENSYIKSVFAAVTAFFCGRLDNYPGGHINGRKNENLRLQGSPGRASGFVPSCTLQGSRTHLQPWTLATRNTATGKRCTVDTFAAATRALYAQIYHYSIIYTIIYYYIIIYNWLSLAAVTMGGDTIF